MTHRIGLEVMGPDPRPGPGRPVPILRGEDQRIPPCGVYLPVPPIRLRWDHGSAEQENSHDGMPASPGLTRLVRARKSALPASVTVSWIPGRLACPGIPQSRELACASCTPFNITMIRFGTKQCRVACRFYCLQNLSEMDRSSW